MMDVALITANANQLRFIVEYNQSSKTYVLAIALIIISLVLQMIVGICLIFKGRLDLKGEDKFRHANKMNNYIVVGVFIITIVNVFVAAFSTGPPPLQKYSQ
ncbi:Ninjurin-1, putative [Pediculus humanus corporis]|uniref:Ninjurin-1, putative n=1 Tax=Pediculus humanus subsp. corporis TaxID=121224 RepID=E0VFE6_PEDHC|nr:Ninjurin-1, putative [Pediculus humanus corporis]EEB12102.1 Ninjurin-1, putative [Pediculus humanus corporis]